MIRAGPGPASYTQCNHTLQESHGPHVQITESAPPTEGRHLANLQPGDIGGVIWLATDKTVQL